MIIKKHPLIFTVIGLLIIILLAIGVLFIKNNSAKTSNDTGTVTDPTVTGRITEVIKQNLTDKTGTYTLNSITKITPLENSSYYVSTAVTDQTSSLTSIPFLIKQTDGMYMTVVLGVGNDFTEDELTSTGLSSKAITQVISLHKSDVPAQEDSQ